MKRNPARIDQAIRHHRSGQLGLARKLFAQAIRSDPADSCPHHLLGVLEMENGDIRAAIPHLADASRLAPGDPETVSDLGRALAAAGLLDQAAKVLNDFLERCAENTDIRFALSTVRLRQQRTEEAARELTRVLERDADHQNALLNLARLEHNRDRNDHASALLEKSLALGGSNWDALLLLARIREEAGDDDGAEVLLREAVSVDRPVLPDAHVRLSRMLERRGDTGGALEVAHQGTVRCPGHDVAWRHQGDLFKRLGRLDEAVAAFDKAHRILRSPGTNYGLDRPEIRRTNRAKLRHDIEQLKYLKELGRDVADLDGLIAEHEQLLTCLPEKLGDGDVVGLHPSHIVQAGGHYNRCVMHGEAQELVSGALSPELDPAVITADYKQREPGITWIDGFLRPEALESLRRYLLESTIWYDADHPNGYVGTYLHDGFNCPLVLQIASELSALLPEIFGDLPLLQLWAYHYDSELAGIDMHADFAAVNVNFWLTPTAAMLDEDTGGMVVWNKEAPLEWTYRDYNTADPTTKKTIDDYLASTGAEQIRIPHRQNRVVIFNSDLFHKTDDICFRPGFENRRINVTMLYGNRDNS